MIIWKPALEVGVPEIDADHRVLVHLLNRVSAAEDDVDALAVLDELERYTQYHFSREEKLMADYGYEFEAEHRRAHRALFFDVKNYIEDLQAGKCSVREVSEFLQRWLFSHLAGEDRLLGAAIRRVRERVAAPA